ncbi:Hypothetical predicted protein [Pelobates cultripes]|uniref:Uncharacterized protein n=1 Tax=Pelobates cultripes TaxID=61616 RepID=A0AAD1RJD5_PELCU|nr:Hypothetical predicted protein [Pelobates cultripes]
MSRLLTRYWFPGQHMLASYWLLQPSSQNSGIGLASRCQLPFPRGCGVAGDGHAVLGAESHSNRCHNLVLRDL